MVQRKICSVFVFSISELTSGSRREGPISVTVVGFSYTMVVMVVVLSGRRSERRRRVSLDLDIEWRFVKSNLTYDGSQKKQ